jgi:hypothetical protein
MASASAGASQEICVIKLGYKASAEQFAPGKLLGFSCLAEEVGFDSVFISDHFQPWEHVDGHAPFSLTWLGELGASTSRVVIGTSVLTPTLSYHPSIVAQAFGTMGGMFPGRVVLGKLTRACDQSARISVTASRRRAKRSLNSGQGGQGAEGQPVVIVRGLTWRGPDNNASELVRPAAEDMF